MKFFFGLLLMAFVAFVSGQQETGAVKCMVDCLETCPPPVNVHEVVNAECLKDCRSKCESHFEAYNH